MKPEGHTHETTPAAMFIYKLARDIQAAHQQLLDIRHAYSPCKAQDFPHLDLAWYAESMVFLEDRNFRDLGCIIDTLRSPAQAPATHFNQLALSGDGLIYADLAHMKTPPHEKLGLFAQTLRWPRDRKIVNLHTEFSNGVHLLTSTAPVGHSIPGIVLRQRSSHAGQPDLLEFHIEQIEFYLSANPEVSAMSLTDLDDVIASDQRLEQKIVEERRRRHRLDEIKLLEMGYPEQVSGMILAEIRRFPVVVQN